MRSKKPILLVEDDIVDVMTVKRALSEINITNELIIAENGEEGLRYLEENQNAFPSIILLDLNMPRMNGIEFLKNVKTDERFKQIPVVVLTTSGEDQDKVESFKFGVAGYMVKPVNFHKFVDIMKAIDVYWTFSDLP
jgi:CheY-like chemotaxis protein